MVELSARITTATLLATLFCLIFLFLPPIAFSALLLVILSLILAFEWPQIVPVKSRLYRWLTPWYPILPFGLLIFLNQTEYRPLLIPLFALVAAFDTGSYLFGKMLGIHKIAPSISPGKTWEGFAGGMLCATLALSLLEWYKFGQLPPAKTIIGLSFIVCMIAFCGDLFESWLKRRAGIKHSGNTLPGHGGFLDRFDGILFAVIFFYLFRDLITVPLHQ